MAYCLLYLEMDLGSQVQILEDDICILLSYQSREERNESHNTL